MGSSGHRRPLHELHAASQMILIIQILLDGLLLRCPRCQYGHMFVKRFKMYHACPVCGLEFERASGEITGGMGINTVLTCLLEVSLAIAFVVGPPVSIEWQIATLVLAGTAFPIAFYRSSRGLWASILYLTGSNTENG
jgi:uncharacterized protein (DUF983 family)